MRRHGMFLGSLVAALLVTGCPYIQDSSDVVVRLPRPSERLNRVVLNNLWRTTLVHREYLLYKPEERSTPAINEYGDKIFVGDSQGSFYSLSTEGQILWRYDIKKSISSHPLVYDNVVYFGAEDGHLYALDEINGSLKWSHGTKAEISQQPLAVEDVVLFASSDQRIVALEAETGKWRWDYNRDMPSGLTIKGQSAPTLAGDRVYAGFDDGVLVSLRWKDGSVAWSKALAEVNSQFPDADATPLVKDGMVIASSYSTGIYALKAEDGETLWFKPIPQATTPLWLGQDLLFSTGEGKVVSLKASTGETNWERRVCDKGALSPLKRAGSYLLATGCDQSLYVLSRQGRLKGAFNPGRLGVSAEPAARGRNVYVVSNGGILYAFQVPPS